MFQFKAWKNEKTQRVNKITVGPGGDGKILEDRINENGDREFVIELKDGVKLITTAQEMIVGLEDESI